MRQILTEWSLGCRAWLEMVKHRKDRWKSISGTICADRALSTGKTNWLGRFDYPFHFPRVSARPYRYSVRIVPKFKWLYVTSMSKDPDDYCLGIKFRSQRLTRNVPWETTRFVPGRRYSEKTSREPKVSGHLSLPLWCQSRHPGRDQFYSHLTPCRTDFSSTLSIVNS